MESSIKISLNSIIHEQKITLPPNLEQLKSTFKKIYNLSEQQLSKIKIYYMKLEKDKKIKKNLENDSDYMNFYLETHPDIIEAEIDDKFIEADLLNNIIPTPDLPNLEDNNNCLRCLEKDCFLVPFIKLHKDKNNNFLINCHCRNNHKRENIPISDYKSFFNKKLEDILCSFCCLNKEKDKNRRLYYCYKCKKYICNLEKCNNSHEKDCDNNDFLQIEKMDSNCIIHGKNLMYFCEDCKVSFCNLCKNHQEHKKLIIDEMNIKNNVKKRIIEMIDKNLNKIKIIYKDIREKFSRKLYNIYEMNKNLLELNKKIIVTLNEKEINGEIYININNCKYIKGINIEENLEYYNNTFKQIEDYFTNEFFEFEEEKQKGKLCLWNKIPIIISFDRSAKKIFKIKKINTKKYDVPFDITISQLHFILRKDMKIKKEGAMFLLINGKKMIPFDLNLQEIYDKYKKDDNLLYLTVASEFVYG